MNWIQEVRVALASIRALGYEVDSVEMSEAVVVKFKEVWLWLRSDGSISVESCVPSGRNWGRVWKDERILLSQVVTRLTARSWVLKQGARASDAPKQFDTSDTFSTCEV